MNCVDRNNCLVEVTGRFTPAARLIGRLFAGRCLKSSHGDPSLFHWLRPRSRTSFRAEPKKQGRWISSIALVAVSVSLVRHVWLTHASQSALRLVLIINFDVISLDADVYSVLAVIITNTVTVTAAADQFASTGWDADLDVNALWSATIARIFASTWVLNSDDLWLCTWRHFVAVLVNHIRVERHSM